MAAFRGPGPAGAECGHDAAGSRGDTQGRVATLLESGTRQRLLVGVGFALCALAVVTALATGAWASGTLARSMAFRPLLQEALNHVQDALALAGAVLLPLALGIVGGTKIAALRTPRAAQLDSWSSYELTDLGDRNPGLARRLLRAAFAGGIPMIASAGVCLAILTTAIGNEVSNGPSRPIRVVLQRVSPGNELVVGYSGAMPMVESDVSMPLADRLVADASAVGVRAHLLRLDLGVIVVRGESLAALTLGVQVPRTSPLAWSPIRGCRLLAAVVGRAAGVRRGAVILDNGEHVEVVGTTSGVSAINRIGVIMDQRAVATCLQEDPTAPVHAVVLSTTPSRARELLARADGMGEPAAVVSTQQYLANSEAFWTSNVKPITNILALVSGLVALVAMAGTVSSRLLRNRREYAAKLASGASGSVMAGVELLRAVKDGLAASLVGSLLALVLVPLTNATEPGFRAGVSRNDILVGCAVGLLGCVGGAALRAVRIGRAVNVSESTRI